MKRYVVIECEIEEVSVEPWKLYGVDKLVELGLMDVAWKDKINEPAPVWLVATLLARVLEKVNK